MKKAVGYIRVSTSGQAKEGFSLPMQESKIRAYCEFNELELADIIADAGISGKNLKGRPGAQKLISLIEHKKVDAVVIYKLDRLGRSTKDLINIAELLEKKHVALHSLTEKLDTSTALGRFFFTLTGALAEMERGIISERTVDGMAKKKSEGGRTTRHAEYGYRYKGDKLVVNPHEQRIVSRIQELNSNGYSLRLIEQTLYEERLFNRCNKRMAATQIFRILGALKKAA